MHAIINCVSNSKEEPGEISIKCEKDLSVLDEPSGILLGIEIEHLLIYDTNPNFSSSGKELVILKTSSTISIPIFQIFKFL